MNQFSTIKSDQTIELIADQLFVLFPGYSAPRGGKAFRDAGAFTNWLVHKLAMTRKREFRRHVETYRDFYANPRTPAYMADLTHEFMEGIRAKRVVVVTDPATTQLQGEISWSDEIRVVPDLSDQTELHIPGMARNSNDAVLLLHADPLGLGLGSLERLLLKGTSGKLFILNGRRRAYRLDWKMHRLLTRRRILAETRIVESISAVLIALVGAMLAFVDRVKGRAAIL